MKIRILLWTALIATGMIDFLIYAILTYGDGVVNWDRVWSIWLFAFLPAWPFAYMIAGSFYHK